MRVRCPSCGRSQRVTEADIGLPTLCHACGNRFDVPAPLSSPSTVPTTTGMVDWSASSTPRPAVTSHRHQNARRRTWPLWIAFVIVAFAAGIGVGWLLRANTTPAVVENAPLQPVQTAPPVPSRPKIVATTAPSSAAMLGRSVPPATQPATRPAAVATRSVPVPHAVPKVPAPPHARSIRAVVPPNANAPDLDQRIGESIDRGTTYLLSQFKNGSLNGYHDVSKITYSGLNSLACYAVLQAGEATHDPRLGPHSPAVEAMLNALRKLPLDRQHEPFPPSPGNPFTYAHSLRAAAFSVFNRKQDREALRSDCEWLLTAQHHGAYTYGVPPRLGGSMADSLWDNSNSQYGALGVWAALQSGLEVPSSYWSQVQKHWLNSQLPNGQWAYAPGGGNPELSMTVAGITMLFVTQDQLNLYEQATTLGRPPFIPALAKGLKWLEAGDHSVSLPYTNRTYNLYGMERAALASGFKYFGSHDWYRELATSAMRKQLSDGSWQEEDPVVDTAFTLLFLSRGRHPILMNKLRFDGSWSNRPRDLANLALYTSKELERPFNWQVVPLSSNWTDWTDSPVLYIASHRPIKLTEDDLAKLRDYAENGGLIYLQTDGDSGVFNTFAAKLAKELFPRYPLKSLPKSDPIFSTLYPLKHPPSLEGVSNGSRLLLVHCSIDVNRVWQLRNWATDAAAFQFGVNLFIYAAGKANFLNKLAVAYIPPSQVNPIATVPVVRLRYDGNYNPEPASLRRWSRVLLNHTSIRADLSTVDLNALKPKSAAVALLTGTTTVDFTSAQAKAVHDYVTNGGVLVIDAAGGSTDFAVSVTDGLLAKAFPGQSLSKLNYSNPIMQRTYTCMKNIKLKLRPYEAEKFGTPTDPIEQLTVGKGRVIFSQHDLTTALLGTNTYPIDGYTAKAATALMDNVLLWAVERPGAVQWTVPIRKANDE